MAKVVWVALWLQPMILGCIKLSILFFYRRIFSVKKSFNITSWVMISLVTGFMIAFTVGLFFDCGTNIAANWGSLSEIAEQCPFGFLPTVIYTILDACFDFIVLILPIPWIWTLQMPTSKKLSVCGCFLLGGIATVAAFIRMAIAIESGIPAAALNRTSIMGVPTWDILGVVSAEMFWHMVETTVAIVAVCLPAIRKVVSWTIFGKWVSLSSLGSFYHNMRSSAARSSANSRSRSAMREHKTASEKIGNVSETSSQVALHSREGHVTQIGKRPDGVTVTSIGKGGRDNETLEMEDLGIYRIDTVTCTHCGEKQYV
ncbi:hypothetical protein LTR85_005773 [Meristemomyces frigidus]|nr:hypothetical protein LTR85_005773 [Meristemomyces frigidus]